MKIRKLYRFEGGHIVRNCSSKRCKYSIHWHSYVVEVFFQANSLDNGQMVYDFGLTKTTIKDIIDSFDHTYAYWNKESQEFRDFMHKHSERYISMPLSPSAEGLSLILLFLTRAIFKNTQKNNGESPDIDVVGVRVHETVTGWAESTIEDLENPKMPQLKLEDIVFSDTIKEEWSDPDMYDKLIQGIPFINPIVDQQIS